VYQISSKSDDFALRYGDLTICNMPDIGHLECSKFRVRHVTFIIMLSASLFKIARKSDNRLLRYGQKQFLKWRPTAILKIDTTSFSHFFCWVWSDLAKISQIGAEWQVDCGDVVEIESRCRIPIWRTFGRIQRHVIV